MAVAERIRDRDRKRLIRAVARDIRIPPIADPRRRRQAEADVYEFLTTYAPETFYNDFTANRCEMVEAILRAAQQGGDQAIAAPRGDGKTTIVEWVTIYCLLLGILRFPLIVAATSDDAGRILGNIKRRFEEAEPLGRDYPEVCTPIRALERAPARAGAQTVNGRFTNLRWSGEFLVFPTVAGSRIGGAILATRSLEGVIRGLRYNDQRPDCVIIDDPETRESVTSEVQTERRGLTIEQDIGGLAGQGQRMARLMLTTIMNRRSLSFRYTDQAQKPSWQGRRYRLIEREPEAQDLWAEYQAMRAQDQQAGDPTGRRVHHFYLDRQEAMDAGAIASDPQRYISEPQPDGTTLEASAIQHFYNLVADRGLEAVLTEYQNDPPEEDEPLESGITAHRVQTQVSGTPQRIVPAHATFLTAGFDVGKFAGHWVVAAWAPDATGWVVDYGIQEVWSTIHGSDEAVDLAILRALAAWRETLLANPYTTADGTPRAIDLALIDAGYRTGAIYKFTREAGPAFKPCMGFGQSNGAVKTSFRPPTRPSKDRKTGEHWFLARKPNRVWLAALDADHWKRWVHDRFLTQPGTAGCLQLFGQPSQIPGRLSDDQKRHMAYSKHLTAETETEEFVPGKGLKRGWKVKSQTNHYFDATYYAAAAASMLGVRLGASQAPRAARRQPAVFAME